MSPTVVGKTVVNGAKSQSVVSIQAAVEQGQLYCKSFTAQPGSYEMKLKPYTSNIDLYLFSNNGPKLKDSFNSGLKEEFIVWNADAGTSVSVCAYGYESGEFSLDVTLTN